MDLHTDFHCRLSLSGFQDDTVTTTTKTASYELLTARAQILHEESLLIASLSALRTRLNALLPISSLPPELLEHIFLFLLSPSQYNAKSPSSHQHTSNTLAYTRVSRHFRLVSLSSPRLWTLIDLCSPSPKLLKEYLARSKKAPLTVVAAKPLKLHWHMLKEMEWHRHVGRVREVDVFLFPNDLVELFLSFGDESGLENEEIEQEKPILISLTSLSLKIPPVCSTFLLDVELPNVRRLVLDCVAVRWEGVHDLTHLSLRGLTPDFSPTINQLHAIFKASPQLESIRLESIAPFDHPSSNSNKNIITPPEERIRLSNLKTLAISAKPHAISSIFRPLFLSPQTRIQLYFSYFSDLLSVFPAGGLPYEQSGRMLYSQQQEPAIKTLRLARHAAMFLRSPTPAWCEFENEHESIVISINSAQSLIPSVLRSFPALFPSSVFAITTLELNTGVMLDIHPCSFFRFFNESMKGVETLRVAFNDMRELLKVLNPMVEDSSTKQPSSSSQSNKLVLPNLRTLSFSKPSDLWWHFADNWLADITECIVERKKYGCMLKVMEFTKCHGISTETTGILEDIGIEVVVLEQF